MSETGAQPFDTTLKALVQEQAEEIVPFLLEGAIYEETLNVELLRPAMRADRVFRVHYRGGPHILHLEFETGYDPKLPQRLAVYHMIIHQEYLLPVITVVIYPFHTKVARPPMREMSGDVEESRVNFRVMPLWELDAAEYLEKHAYSMYALLPAMRGVTDELLLKAMQGLMAHYQDNQPLLAHQFVWMQVILDRAHIIPEAEKQKVRKELNMYDNLWNEDPTIQRIKAEAEAKGRAEGRAEERAEAEAKAQARVLESLREVVVGLAEVRFPDLVDEVKEKSMKIKDAAELKILIKHLTKAPDENVARYILENLY